ncbi:MAG: cadherin-like domain-containing protein, partial [Calditrichaeota bacterium]|nr:cadherin-like domain-containing protein [Calditrichota bacterium]
INATAPGVDFIPTYNNTSLLLTTQLANVAPVATNDTTATDEDVALGVNVLANDYDLNGDAISITGFTQPAHGAVTQVGDSVLNYTPASNFFGSDTFTYIIAEGSSLSDTAMVLMTVNPVNDPPAVTGIPDVNFPEDGSTTLDLDPYASDIDNDPATLTWSANVIAAQAGTQPESGESKKDGISGIEVDPGDLQISIDPATHVASFSSTADTSGI